MKTVRFAEVVRRAGRPEIHPLWVEPKGDRALQTAIRQHRVVTVHQELHGGTKDFAAVGFREEPAAQYLVFPKSVRRFADRRIIAIDYDLLATPTGNPAEPRRAKAKNHREPVTAERKPLAVARAPKPKPASEAGPTQPAETSGPGLGQPIPVAAAPAKRPAGKLGEEKTSPEPTQAKASPAVDARLHAELQRAMNELKVGKTVAAYERLRRLVGG